MGHLFRLLGSFGTEPARAALLSGVSDVAGPLDERVNLSTPHRTQYEIDDDDPVDVAFGGLESAHVVVLKTTGGKVRARLTSADGTDQSVPVDGIMILISQSVPVTAIDLTRVTGGNTVTVDVFLGEK